MTTRAQKLSQAIKEVSWDWETMAPSHPHTIAVATLRALVNDHQYYQCCEETGVEDMVVDARLIYELCDELEALK